MLMMSGKSQSKLLLRDLSAVLTKELSENIALLAINKDLNTELQILLENLMREFGYIDKKDGYLVVKESENRVSLELCNVTTKISDHHFKKLVDGNEYLIPNRNVSYFTIFFSGNNLCDRKKSMVTSLTCFINETLQNEPKRREKFRLVFENFLKNVNISDYNFLEEVVIKMGYADNQDDVFDDICSWDFDDSYA